MGTDKKAEKNSKKGEKAAKSSGYSADALDPSNHDVPGPSGAKVEHDADEQQILHPAPQPAQPGNINLQTFPAPVEVAQLKPMQRTMQKTALVFGAGLVLVWFFTARGAGYKTFLFRSTLIGAIGVLTIAAVGVYTRQLEKDIERVRNEMHRQRGLKHSPPTPESVEWLNAIIATAWPLLDPGIFASISDQIEDVMQASLPGIVDAVKVADMSQGKNPLRIISMRGLPDRMDDPKHPQEEWITGGSDGENKSLNEDDNAGDYLNLEVALSYQAKPGQGSESKLRENNLHMLYAAVPALR